MAVKKGDLVKAVSKAHKDTMKFAIITHVGKLESTTKDPGNENTLWGIWCDSQDEARRMFDNTGKEVLKPITEKGEVGYVDLKYVDIEIIETSKQPIELALDELGD